MEAHEANEASLLKIISGVFFLFLRTLKRYNKSNINRFFKIDKFLERRKFQQFFSNKIVLLIMCLDNHLSLFYVNQVFIWFETLIIFKYLSS